MLLGHCMQDTAIRFRPVPSPARTRIAVAVLLLYLSAAVSPDPPLRRPTPGKALPGVMGVRQGLPDWSKQPVYTG